MSTPLNFQNKQKLFLALFLGLGLVLCSFIYFGNAQLDKQWDHILTYQLDPRQQDLRFYWKDQNDNNYVHFNNLKTDLERSGRQLLFAMNGGMYQKDLSPQGLYIEQGQVKAPLIRKQDGYGNFYLQPNGIFFLTKDRQAGVISTAQFELSNHLQYATQSGPMLVIDGAIHSKFTKGSSHLNIRNGVGLLPNGDLLFAMSKEKINLFDFATFFKEQGCQNALYLDGFVSKTYLPAKNWEQVDGTFGVIIAETE